MMSWVNAQIADARRQIAAGNSRIVERRYMPVLFCAGVMLGVLIALGSDVLGALTILIGGAAIGYGARSYVSHRRRQAVLARRL